MRLQELKGGGVAGLTSKYYANESLGAHATPHYLSTGTGTGKRVG